MVLLDNGEVESEDEKESLGSEEHEEYAAQGELLMMKKVLNVQAQTEEEAQRENLFHSRCLVQDKVCSLIIDGGSCTNVASEYLVAKLGMTVAAHPKPYNLQWLNDEGEMRVSKQVLVPITIGNYEDEVMCDILPMGASHILLGRPWQYDRRVIHDGSTNKYSFEYKGRKHTLVPLTPLEIYQDQKKKGKQVKGKQSNFLAKSGITPRTLLLHSISLKPVFDETLLSFPNDVPELPSRNSLVLQDYKHEFSKEKQRGLLLIKGKKYKQLLLNQSKDQNSMFLFPTPKAGNYLQRMRTEQRRHSLLGGGVYLQPPDPMMPQDVCQDQFHLRDKGERSLELNPGDKTDRSSFPQHKHFTTAGEDYDAGSRAGRLMQLMAFEPPDSKDVTGHIPTQTLTPTMPRTKERCLRGKYLLSINYDGSNLSLFLAGLRTNLFQLREDDMILRSNTKGEQLGQEGEQLRFKRRLDCSTPFNEELEAMELEEDEHVAKELEHVAEELEHVAEEIKNQGCIKTTPTLTINQIRDG